MKLFINPTVVLLSIRTDDSVLNVFESQSQTTASENGTGEASFSFCALLMWSGDQPSLPYVFELRPPSEFHYESSLPKLASLQLGRHNITHIRFEVPGALPVVDAFETNDHAQEYSSQRNQLLRLSATVDLNSRLTVGCAGAVLSYLQRRKAAKFHPGDGAARAFFNVASVEMFTLKDTMFIISDTLQSLQIMLSETHPSSQNQGPTTTSSCSKEGLSIYGLFHHLTRTPQGKQRLKEYFLRPSTNLGVLNERLDAIGVFTQPANAGPLGNIVKALSSVVNARVLLVKLKKGASGGNGQNGNIAKSVWSGLQKLSFHAIGILREFEQVVRADALPIYCKVRKAFDTFNLAQVGRMISEVVDFEQSKEQQRTVVKYGLDEELDEQRRTYDGIASLLSKVAYEIAANIPAGLAAELNVVFFPQIGFLIAMPMDAGTGRAVWEGAEDERWEKMFSSEKIVYYKDEHMQEMDERFGDMYGQICDREIEILYELAQKVLQFEDMLANVSDLCGELDCLLALAQGASKYRLFRVL